MKCKTENCNHTIIPIWKNPKEHGQEGKQEYLHKGLKRQCPDCNCNEPFPAGDSK